MEVYEVLCEWDVGQEYQLFSSLEKAMVWIENNQNIRECLEGDDTISGLFDEGLLHIQERPVV